VTPVWALYSSTLIAVWQRLVSLNISWDCDFLYKVIRKREIFAVVVPVASDTRVAGICLTLITSKPSFTISSEMPSAGVETGRCRVTAYISFWDLG
jgi:hypothetical protein